MIGGGVNDDGVVAADHYEGRHPSAGHGLQPPLAELLISI